MPVRVLANRLRRIEPEMAADPQSQTRAMRRRRLGLLFLVAPFAFIYVSLFVGRYPLSIGQIFEILWLKISGTGAS